MSKSRLIFLFLEVPWVASLNRKRLVGPIQCGQLKVWNTISPDLDLMSEGTKQVVLLELTVPWDCEAVAVCLGLLEIYAQQ